MCFSVLLLAAAAAANADDLPPPDSYQAMGWISASIFALAGGVYYVLCVWEKLFPKTMPPAHEVYATKAELLRVEQEQEEETKRIERRFEQWMEQEATQHRENLDKLEEVIGKFGEWQLSIERALGHVETKADLQLKNLQRK